MDEQPYIDIGGHRYPVNTPIPTQIVMDEKSPDYVSIANLKQSWSNMRNMSGSVKLDTVELTEHGKALFQEYLANGQCDFTISYTSLFPVQIVSRRRPRPRNTRIQMVQAKRKALDLDIDGRYCGIRTRRASLAYVQAVEEWIIGKRSVMPRRAEFRYIPARVRRKGAKRALRWKPINLSDSDREFIAQYGYDPLINPFGVTEQDLGELNNVNRTYN